MTKLHTPSPMKTIADFRPTDKAPMFLTYWKQLAPYLSEPTPLVSFMRWEFDWCWPSLRVAVEVDGGQYAPYGGRHARDKDREKHNTATAYGWRVFHFSPQQLERNPSACIELVALAVCDAQNNSWQLWPLTVAPQPENYDYMSVGTTLFYRLRTSIIDLLGKNGKAGQ